MVIHHDLSCTNNNIVNIENFFTLLKDIAKCQASELCKKTSETTDKVWDVSIKSIISQVVSSRIFGTLDNGIIERIESLQEAVDMAVKDGVSVRNYGIGKNVPIPYEVLNLIFVQTTEKFRQTHFHELLNFFYKELHSNLKLNESNLCIERSQFDFEVKTLLPVVKLEILLEILATGSRNQEKTEELVSNIKNFLNNPRLNQEDIYEVVRNKLRTNNFDLNSYELVQLDQRNGHLGDYFRLHVNISRETFEDLNFFAKFLTPKSEFLKDILKLGPSMKEEFFYMVFLPKLREFGLGDMLDFAPECYFSRVDDVLVLDNLSEKDFVGLSPNNKLDFGALKLAVRSLAKYHACSFLFEELLSKKENSIVRLSDMYWRFIKETLFLPEAEHMKLYEGVLETQISYLLSEFPDIKRNYSDQEIREKASKGYELAFEKLKPSEKFRNVICHGDVYVSNMMFKFDKLGQCSDVKLIDFQILRYCPPTHDLMFFLYQNSLKRTLDTHFDELIEEYYNSLANSLAKYDVNINSIYTRDAFEECVQYMKPEGLIHALFYSPLQTLDPEFRERLTQDDDEILNLLFKEPLEILKIGLKDQHYREVMRGLCEHFIEMCDSGLL